MRIAWITVSFRGMAVLLAGAVGVAGVVGLAGCGSAGRGPVPVATVTSGVGSFGSAAPTSGPAPGGGQVLGGPAGAGDVTGFTVKFGFAVPGGPVSVSHPVSAPPLRTLVGIYVGDHPTDTPAFQRMTFYFRGGFPSYQVGYVPAVLSEGQGAPISLPGNAFLRVGFTDAQAHDASGGSSVLAAPGPAIGLANLKGYGSAGDFEGHVTFGLGLQVAAGSGQTLPIRVGELVRADGAGGSFYVVFVDVQAG